MLGNPKYRQGQIVTFLTPTMKEGIIEIVDVYGTFEDNTDVSYDILVPNENCLYKHINEKFIVK